MRKGLLPSLQPTKAPGNAISSPDGPRSGAIATKEFLSVVAMAKHKLGLKVARLNSADNVGAETLLCAPYFYSWHSV